MNQVTDFLAIYTCGMVVLLVMEILHLADVDGTPVCSPTWEDIRCKTDFLVDLSAKIVDTCFPSIVSALRMVALDSDIETEAIEAMTCAFTQRIKVCLWK